MTYWQKTLVTPDQSIEHAIKVINETSLQIALVCDKENTLLGTVTDGDIRRALLQNRDLSCPVNQVMCTQPVVVGPGTSITKIKAIMSRHSVQQIPKVAFGKVIDLITAKDIDIAKRKSNPVFLMAGGFGKRLKPLTDNCPKPLLKIGDKPILETILESFIEHGFYRFYISTHYLHEKITDYFGDGERWGVEINYVHESTPLGTAGALSLLPETIDEPILMMNGDLLTKVNFNQLLSYHQDTNATATMCVRKHEYQIPYGVVQSDGDRVAGIVEKPVHSFFINAGIYVISPQLRAAVQQDKVTDMPDLLQREMDTGKHVSLFPIHEYWLDIGKMPDYNQAQQDFHTDFSSGVAI